MQSLEQIPEWLGAAIIGAVIALLGFVGKQLFASISEWRTQIRVRHARLVELFSLLQAGKVAFSVQLDNRNRLGHSIKERNPAMKSVRGYERLFTEACPNMTDDEKQLHSIIRAYTVHTIRPLNESILRWLKEDVYFKAQMWEKGHVSQLARKLSDLEAHLLLWQAKYTIWIPDNPSHSLVYLGDEEKHGLAFPRGIENDVLKVIKGGANIEVRKITNEKKKELDSKASDEK